MIPLAKEIIEKLNKEEDTFKGKKYFENEGDKFGD
jgi:hypothetical protein